MHNIVAGQAVHKHEPPTDSTISINNPIIRSEINSRLGNELNDIILSPVIGIQKIRKVLHRFGLDIPALYDLDSDGDEVVLEMDQYGKVHDSYHMPQFDKEEAKLYYLYIIYLLTDDGVYEFHSELTDEDGIEDIMAEFEEEIHNHDV